MTKKKIQKLLLELASLRRKKGNITSREIIRFANKCGRKKRTGSIGKEPTYLNEHLPYSKPLSIPYHSGNMPPGTAGNILAILEQDLFEIEETLESKKRVDNDEEKNRRLHSETLHKNTNSK
jgi:hypothetical protein